MNQAEALAPFLGAWQLVGCTRLFNDGSREEVYGDDPLGQIMYSADGHMSAQLMPPAPPREGETVSGYTGYFGSVSVDTATQTITHHVAGSDPRWLMGTDQPRGYRFEDDRLILAAEMDGVDVRVVWRKRLAQGFGA